MRDIRFRAWVSENKSFLHASLVGDNFELRQTPIFDGMILNPKIEKWDQFTGLKDKNGKDIFEGDIVKNLRHKGQLIEIYWKGIQEEELGWLCFGGWSFRKLVDDEELTYATYEGEIEIIGNIYENGDLLKGNDR